MDKYRKKPVEIQAVQLSEQNLNEVGQWCGGKIYEPWEHFDGYILISTLEGEMIAEYGDWIIRGIAGEFYPCKADIFEQSYDRVE